MSLSIFKDWRAILFLLLMLGCFHPEVSGGMALIVGMVLSLSVGNPLLAQTKKWNSELLKIAVTGLGFGMNLLAVAKAGASGFGYTGISILAALGLGWLLAKALKIPKDMAVLISAGTAICGGSAIASVGAAIRAKSEELSVSLASIFFLNAIGLLIFPKLGHFFQLSEVQFGLWSALAIHDTSSVVGATMLYGPHALEVGTTIKLARALWIVPLTFGFGYLYSANRSEIKYPWFILGFLLASALATWLPAFAPVGNVLFFLSRRLLTITLFFTGANLTRDTLKAIGVRPLVMAVLLWICVASGSLLGIFSGWISA